MEPESYSAIWLALATEELLECTDSHQLRVIATRLRDMAELADRRAAELGPDLQDFLIRAASEKLQ